MPSPSRSKPAQPKPRARRWGRRLLISSIFSVTLLACFYFALTCTPGWYAPPEIDRTRLREDKHTHLEIENSISDKLNRGESVTIELTEEQVNRWIAARDELWPGKVPSLDPLEQPQVNFLEGGRIRVAGLVRQNLLSVVTSIVLRVSADGANLGVEWESLHAGALPAPNALVRRVAESLDDTGDVSPDEIAAGRVDIPNDFTWPNGKRRCRVQSIETGEGVLRVTLKPY